MPSNKNIPMSIDSPIKEATPIFEPIFGKIVVKIEKNPERKYGNVILPQKNAMSSTMGKVYAVYQAEETPEGYVEPQVSVGDTVLFGQFTGTAINVGRDLFVICREHDLLTILRFDEEEGEKPIIEEVIE